MPKNLQAAWDNSSCAAYVTPYNALQCGIATDSYGVIPYSTWSKAPDIVASKYLIIKLLAGPFQIVIVKYVSYGATPTTLLRLLTGEPYHLKLKMLGEMRD